MKQVCSKRTTYGAVDFGMRRARKGNKRTLVVVDMQPGFIAGCVNPRFVDAVLLEIQRARRLGWAIVVLEMAPRRKGRTALPIRQALEGYDRVRYQRKWDDDGSREVIVTCLDNGYSMEDFTMVGVYTDACVEGTAFGLLERLPESKVRVVKRACSTNTPQGCWDNLNKHRGPRCVVA